MPQNGLDSVVYNNGNTTVYYDDYNSLSPEMKHFVDSVSNGAAQGQTIVSNFKKKSDEYSSWALPLTIFLFVGTWYLTKFLNKNPFHLKLDDDAPPLSESYTENTQAAPQEYEPVLVYEGRSLHLSEEIVISILVKLFPYYNALPDEEQKRFLFRHQRFMSGKTFNIHDASGFREMPVLISAAAIQLSFGLQKYELESYPYINIFPQEFVRADSNGICFLEGNVSANCINISWKHFLNGFLMPGDGDNVGLHEMAHAYYCQNMECGTATDRGFVRGWPAFNTAGNKAFETEKTAVIPFYSTYAQRNFQEFWAESIERFFERGGEMKNTYPDVYSAISMMLNQSTAGE